MTGDEGAPHWMERNGDLAVFGCNASSVTWQLRCEGDQWLGDQGICPGVSFTGIAFQPCGQFKSQSLPPKVSVKRNETETKRFQNSFETVFRLWRPERFVLAETKRFQHCLKTVLKPFCFSSISMCGQHKTRSTVTPAYLPNLTRDCTPPRTRRPSNKLLPSVPRVRGAGVVGVSLQSGTHYHLTVARLSSPAHSTEAWSMLKTELFDVGHGEHSD